MNNNIKELISLIPKLSLRYFIENMSLPGLIHSSSDIDPYLDYEFVKIKKKHIAVSLNCSSILDSKNSIESGERIPLFLWEATRALMNNIDREIIAAAVAGIGNIYGTGSTPSAMSDVTGTALKLNNTMCPIDGRHFVISPQVYANFSNVQGFIAADYRGQSNAPVISGRLGTTHNFDFFIDQNLSNISNTSGTIGTNATGSNNTAVVNGALSSGAESMAVDGAALTTGTLKKGQKFTFAGLNQEYTLTADATMVSGAATLSFAPFLQSAIADNTVITFQKSYKVEGIAFHPDCIALAWQDFDPIPSAYGVIVYDEVDPISGAKIRFKSYHQNNQTILELQVSFAVGIVRPEFGALLATYTGAGTSPV